MKNFSGVTLSSECGQDDVANVTTRGCEELIEFESNGRTTDEFTVDLCSELNRAHSVFRRIKSESLRLNTLKKLAPGHSWLHSEQEHGVFTGRDLVGPAHGNFVVHRVRTKSKIHGPTITPPERRFR